MAQTRQELLQEWLQRWMDPMNPREIIGTDMLGYIYAPLLGVDEPEAWRMFHAHRKVHGDDPQLVCTR